MTPEIFSNLTDNDYKKLITDICNIDILVSLYSKDSYATPKIKSISFLYFHIPDLHCLLFYF